VKVTFNISPFTAKIKQMNYSSLIDVGLGGCQKVKVEIVDEQIVVTLKYSANIDQMTA
jgi:hypothetical protein